MEKTIVEQHTVIRICWKAGFNATKTFEMIQKVYGESVVCHATLCCWYNAFSGGRESIRDEQRSGKPMTKRMRENIARVVDILKEDCQCSCRLIVEQMGISKTIVCNKS